MEFGTFNKKKYINEKILGHHKNPVTTRVSWAFYGKNTGKQGVNNDAVILNILSQKI